MYRYIVVSCDIDEQQTFVDFLHARDAEHAEEQVLAVRSYVCHAVAFTPETLEELADECETKKLWSPFAPIQ